MSKVRNIEHAGGRLAIVIDEKDENIENVIMVDDGNGNGIRIPSMLISKQDGNAIKEFLLEKNKRVALMATFEMDKPDNRVEYDFWYTSSDDRALDFLRDFRANHLQFGKDVLMSPHFAFWTCEGCDETIQRRDCFGGGAYCAINEKNLNTTGNDILMEDLRQHCLHRNLQKGNDEGKWWAYIAEFHRECYNEVTEDCSRNAHKRLELDWKDTQNCVDDSFLGSGDQYKQKNKIFEDEKDYYQKYGPSFFPGLVINNRTYMGVLDPENVFQAICAGFKDQRKECKVHTFGEPEPNGISITKLLMIIVGLVLLNIGLIFCYRKYSKKEVNEQMQMHINSAVAQYFALQDKELKPQVE